MSDSISAYFDNLEDDKPKPSSVEQPAWKNLSRPLKAKLVRDKLPGKPVNSQAGRHLALGLKLHEEVQEILDDPTNAEEYGDLLEAMLELARINRVNWQDIEEAMLAKRDKKGGFRRATIMIDEL